MQHERKKNINGKSNIPKGAKEVAPEPKKSLFFNSPIFFMRPNQAPAYKFNPPEGYAKNRVVNQKPVVANIPKEPVDSSDSEYMFVNSADNTQSVHMSAGGADNTQSGYMFVDDEGDSNNGIVGGNAAQANQFNRRQAMGEKTMNEMLWGAEQVNIQNENRDQVKPFNRRQAMGEETIKRLFGK